MNEDSRRRPPRIAFAGLGWIGRHRMQAILETGRIEAVALLEPDDAAAQQALGLAEGATRVRSYEELLACSPDGVVIATPNALHAEQSLAALRAGAAVFCQKPLARTAAEAAAVVEAAAAADRLLVCDLSYRRTQAMERVRDLVAGGDLGRVFAVDLVFHNAYGPDKPWFYDRALSGGGCVMDLGVHLVDLALWTLGFPRVREVRATLYAKGEPLLGEHAVEDYATATLETADDVNVRLTCSWNLHAGRDAVIGATFYGRDGAAAFHNVDGSFYAFSAEHCEGTQRRSLASPPDAWGGRRAADWAIALADGARFDRSADELVAVASVMDRIYGR